MKTGNLKPFQPGQSGNPKGRPTGARSKLGEAFLEALCADFQEHGAETIERVRIEMPAQYLKVVASLMPRELNVKTDPYADITDEELVSMIRLLNETIRADYGIDIDALETSTPADEEKVN